MNKEHKEDIPLSLALLLLGGVVAGLVLAPPLISGELPVEGISRFLQKNEDLLFLQGVVLLINAFVVSAVIQRILGLRKQGARLKALRKEGLKLTNLFWKKLGFSLSASALTLFCLESFHLSRLQATLPFLRPGTWNLFDHFLRFNISFAAFVGLWMSTRLISSLSTWRIPKSLPPYPIEKNQLVLGSIHELNDEEAPGWASMNLKALNGNIMMTGSIGSGKTQGGVLIFFDQLTQNFSPLPSILALDPKGTFVAEARKLCQQQGLSASTLWMSLDGRVTFNPIYHPEALKNSRFIDIAQMIRAAAINYAGMATDDSPFWETAGFNLIKNSLVLCATVHSYYTLSDLYKTMVEMGGAKDDDIVKIIEKALKDRRFGEEERYNIEKAHIYFLSEYLTMDERTRSGVLTTATNFLNQFQEYRAARVFCPKQEDLTLSSMDEVIDEGKILLFSISSPGLARSMGTFLKLHYEQSVLNRLTDGRSKERPAVLIIDEYQDVVSTGQGKFLGDDRFLAKAREANAVMIAASQSLTSIENSVGKKEAASELFQNFRTRIALHSTDLRTIHAFQECAGQWEQERVSTSYGELSQDAKRNIVHGDFESARANLSESVSISPQKEYQFTAKDFATLRSFEAFAQIYDGMRTEFKKLFLKPFFLKDRRISHQKLVGPLVKTAAALLIAFILPNTSFSFPNVCTALSASHSDSCMDFQVSSCMCGWPVPRPCARFTYYLPQTFIEVVENAKETYFSNLPGAAGQIYSLESFLPYGVVSDDDTQAYHAHVVTVPLLSVALNLLPCRGRFTDKFCFDAMSEHLGELWRTGSGDSFQPNWLAWSVSPQACLLKGAATSMRGGSEGPEQWGGPMCSAPITKIKKFPPSQHSACNGWGLFYPRSGVVTGPSDSIGALMIASRIKSLSSEVLHSTRSSFEEKWQMISPQSSSCFNEGQNIAPLELTKNVTQIGRLKGRLKGYLFTVWQKYSCCHDWAEVPAAYAALEVLKTTCQSIGGDL